MFGTWRDRTHFYYEGDSGGGTGNDPAPGAPGSPAGNPTGKPLVTDDELTDAEFEALPPKVKARIEKERTKAAEEAKAKTQSELAEEQKRKDLEDIKKKAQESNDTATQLKLEKERADKAEAALEQASKDKAASDDLNARLKVVSEHKLPAGYVNYLGSDPTKYIEAAKEHQKNLRPSGTNPTLEGGNQNNPTSKKDADESAKKHLAKFRL